MFIQDQQRFAGIFLMWQGWEEALLFDYLYSEAQQDFYFNQMGKKGLCCTENGTKQKCLWISSLAARISQEDWLNIMFKNLWAQYKR